MKKIGILLIFLALHICVNAQSYELKGDTLIQSNASSSQTDEKTQITLKAKDGKLYVVYITKTGRCYTKRISKKTGKEYKAYLNNDIAREICKKLGKPFVEK